MALLATDPAIAAPARIRLGYHGSPGVAERIVGLTGRTTTEVVLAEYDVADPFAAIRAGELDVMIAKFVLDEPDLVRGRVLDTDPRAAVVGAGHPLAGRASVSVEELADYPSFEAPGRMPAYVWDHVVPPVTPAGRPIRRTHRPRSVPEMMQLVTSTDAVHVSLLSLADIAPPTVRVVPIRDLPAAPVMLAWRRDLGRSDVHRFVADADRSTSR